MFIFKTVQAQIMSSGVKMGCMIKTVALLLLLQVGFVKSLKREQVDENRLHFSEGQMRLSSPLPQNFMKISALLPSRISTLPKPNLITPKDKLSSTTTHSSSLSSSTNGRKFVSVRSSKESAHEIASYFTSLRVAHADWVVHSTESADSDQPTSAHEAGRHRKTGGIFPYNTSTKHDMKSEAEIIPFQTELIFLIKSRPSDDDELNMKDKPGESDDESSDSGAQWDNIKLFDRHVNDPDFIFSNGSSQHKIKLLIPLTPNSKYKRFFAACSGGDGFDNVDDKHDDSPVNIRYPFDYYNDHYNVSHGVMHFPDFSHQGPLNRENDEEMEDTETNGRFRLISHLVKFAWGNISTNIHTGKADEPLSNVNDTIWLHSCPPGILCMGESQITQPKALSAHSPPVITEDVDQVEHAGSFILNISDPVNILNFTEDLTTSTPITGTPATSFATIAHKPLRKVKVSKSEAFTVSHQCRTMRNTIPKHKHPVGSEKATNNHNKEARFLVVDMNSVFQAWLNNQALTTCHAGSRFSRTFVFSLRLEEITDPHLPIPTPPAAAPHAYAFLPNTTLETGLRISHGNEALLTAKYQLDGKIK